MPAIHEGKVDKIEPGRRLYVTVRAALVGKETSLKAWCRENDVAESTAKAALYGYTLSPAAEELRGRIMRAAGITEGE